MRHGHQDGPLSQPAAVRPVVKNPALRKDRVFRPNGAHTNEVVVTIIHLYMTGAAGVESLSRGRGTTPIGGGLPIGHDCFQRTLIDDGINRAARP